MWIIRFQWLIDSWNLFVDPAAKVKTIHQLTQQAPKIQETQLLVDSVVQGKECSTGDQKYSSVVTI